MVDKLYSGGGVLEELHASHTQLPDDEVKGII